MNGCNKSRLTPFVSHHQLQAHAVGNTTRKFCPSVVSPSTALYRMSLSVLELILAQPSTALSPSRFQRRREYNSWQVEHVNRRRA